MFGSLKVLAGNYSYARVEQMAPWELETRTDLSTAEVVAMTEGMVNPDRVEIKVSDASGSSGNVHVVTEISLSHLFDNKSLSLRELLKVALENK